jgi:hypothetical protein
MLVCNEAAQRHSTPWGSSVLKLTSRFILQVLPYLLMAMATVVLLPGVADTLIAAALPGVSSPTHETETTIGFGFEPTAFDLIRQDHEAFAPNRSFGEIAKAVEDDLVSR